MSERLTAEGKIIKADDRIDFIDSGTAELTKGEIDMGDYSYRESKINDSLRDKNTSRHIDGVK